MPRQAKGLNLKQLRELTRVGAEATLTRLRAEIVAMERTFPELALPQTRRAVRRSLKTTRGRTRGMTAGARKAVSRRMKRYWAERRKAQGKVK
jgi:hypothetical protein